MTVSNTYAPTRVAISGYDYDFTFKADLATELLVYTIATVLGVETPTLLTYATDYTVTLDGVTGAGSIETGSFVLGVWTAAEPTGDEILILRNTAQKQTADIPTRGGFKESVIEGGLDNLAKQIQELNYKLDLIVDDDSTATLNSIAAAQAAQTAAELAQTGAETAETGAEAAVTAAISTLTDTTTGHRHDGVESRKVLVTSLDITGITDGHFLKRSGTGIVGVAEKVVKIFTANGNFTVPAGITKVYLTMIGGGGGGGGNTGANYAGGGGGGGQIFNFSYTVAPLAVLAVVIGAGGAGGASGDNDGVNGNSTSFNAAVIAPGGGKGSKGSVHTGGTSPLTPVYAKTASLQATSALPGTTGTATNQGGAGGSTSFGVGGAGGASAAGVAAAANTGAGGGGAAGAAQAGGNGGSGIVIVMY